MIRVRLNTTLPVVVLLLFVGLRSYNVSFGRSVPDAAAFLSSRLFRVRDQNWVDTTKSYPSAPRRRSRRYLLVCRVRVYVSSSYDVRALLCTSWPLERIERSRNTAKPVYVSHPLACCNAVPTELRARRPVRNIIVIIFK